MAKHKERKNGQKKIGLSAEEAFQFSQVVMFRGDQNPANFVFTAEEYDHPDITIPEYALLGYALATLKDHQGNIVDKDDVLVWEGETVVRRRQERPRNKKRRENGHKK